MKVYRCDFCKERENEDISLFYRFKCKKPSQQKFRVIVPSINAVNVFADEDYFNRTEPEILGEAYQQECEFILCPMCMSKVITEISGKESKVVFQAMADERKRRDADDDD